MTLRRRQFLQFAVGTVAIPAFSRMTWAQAYPTRPVRLIVGQTAGGAQDIFARLIGQWLSERTGQQFVIENKPGAGTNIATEAVVRSPADGYTLLLVGAPNAINATLYDNLSFNFLRDIVPVASFIRTPEVLIVNPSVPARTIPEFIAYAKNNPGTISIASPGVGSGPHMSAALLMSMADVNLIHVPYRGGSQAITDLIGGQVQANFTAPVVAIEHIKSGKVRALAVTTAMRSHVMLDVPSMAEFLPGYESGGFFGIGAPRNTAADIINRLNREINAALADAGIRMRIADMGALALTGSPADFGKLLNAETEKWANVIKVAGIKAS